MGMMLCWIPVPVGTLSALEANRTPKTLNEIKQTRRSERILLAVCAMLLLLSFCAGMLWEVGLRHHGPFLASTRFRLGFTKIGIDVYDHLTLYVIPPDHRDCTNEQCN